MTATAAAAQKLSTGREEDHRLSGVLQRHRVDIDMHAGEEG